MSSEILLCIDEVLLNVRDADLLFFRGKVDDLVGEFAVLVGKEEVGTSISVGEDSNSGWVLNNKVCVREVEHMSSTVLRLA